MQSLDTFAKSKLKTREDKGLLRVARYFDRGEDMAMQSDGASLLSFADNDYLGLSQHPDVKSAAISATKQFGTGAGASRLITGEPSLYKTLEGNIAALKGGEKALVFGSGYLVNLGVIPALLGSQDVIFIDELSHACLFAGSQMSGAKIITYRHNDMADLEHHLTADRRSGQNAMIITESVFSMDGNRSPTDAICVLGHQFDAWPLIDDAHGLGVIENGRGGGIKNGKALDIPLQTGTLSKAAGAYGGYLVASQYVIELMRNRARTLVYTTGLPPATLAAANAAIEIIASDPSLAQKACDNARYFADMLSLNAPDAAICPLIIGEAEQTMVAQKQLEEDGFYVAGVRPPTVPEGTSRLRFSFSATHKTSDINRLLDVLKKIGIN